MIPGASDESGDLDSPRCSAKGCQAAATIDLRWRNPKLHDEAREKHWLACDEHGDHLADFLARRGFLLGRTPFAAWPAATATASSPPRVSRSSNRRPFA